MKQNVAMIALFVLGAQCGSGKPAYEATAVIVYAKTLDVAGLDSALPSEQLERWLRDGPARLDHVAWRVSEDCDIKRTYLEEPREGWPLCVKFNFRRDDGVSGWGMLTVGTWRKGVDGSPRFEYASALRRIGKRFESENVKKLSEFPSMIDRLAASQ